MLQVTTASGPLQLQVAGTGALCVFLVHGGRYDHRSWAPQSLVFARRGLRTFAYDLPGLGARAGETPGAMADPDAAARELLELVRDRRESGGCARTAVLGGSLGGGIAARASALSEPGEIERLVLLAPSSSAHPEAIRSLPLVILAAGDHSGDDRRPRWPVILREFEAMPAPKRLLVLPGEAHAQALFDAEGGHALIEEIADFLLAGNGRPAVQAGPDDDLTEP